MGKARADTADFAETHRWRRLLIFYAFLLGIIIVIQTSYPAQILDTIVGLHWAEPWVEIIRGETHGLIVVFLISLYLEIVMTHGIHELIVRREDARAGAQFRYVSSLVTPQRMVTSGLERLYPTSPHATELFATLSQHRQPFTDVSIDWLLYGETSAASNYKFYLKYEFQTQRESYLIALVRLSRQKEQLISANIVDEVFVLSSSADLDAEVQSFVQGSRFIIRRRRGEGQSPVPFVLLDGATAERLLRPAGLSPDECRVLEITFPNGPPDADQFMEYSFTLNLSTAEHYCYWSATTLMYVNSIKIDTSRFPGRRQWKFFVQPFLGTAPPSEFGPTDDVYVLPVRGWVTPGHGVALIWQEASAPVNAGTGP